MTIPAISQLKAEARSALEQNRDQKQTALVYSAVLVGSSVLVLLLDYLLSRMISGMGGLSNLGTRTILSSLQTMLPIAQSLALLGWNAGYFLVILKLLRRQDPDRKTLSSGFSLFFPMLRCMLLEGFLYFNIAFLSFFLSVQIYSFTPWAKAMIQTLEPVLPAMLENPEGFVLDASMLDSVLKGILPMMLIFSVLYLVLFLPVSYRLRFSTFCLVDAPRAGAMHAMYTSRVLLRRNCWKLFRLDLHFWWYHGLLAVASLIQMLPLMGFVLPVGSDATYYLCNGVYLAIVFGLYAAFRNRIECTYAAAYDALRERPKANSVVLGTIFDM